MMIIKKLNYWCVVSCIVLCSHAWSADLTLTAGAHLINTDTGMIDSGVWPDFDGTTFDFTNLTIESGANVSVTGSQPLRITVTQDVVIDGLLDISGQNGGDGGGDAPGGAAGLPGPGGFAGGAGGGLLPGTNTEDGAPGSGPGGGGGAINGGATSDSAGGGGGGHRTAGGNGRSTGAPSVAGTGGLSYISLPPLQGGSGGGGGAIEDDDPQQSGTPGPEDDGGGGGGGGGGAVSMFAQTITIGPTGVIDARGGNGGNANAGIGPAGGGGGAGGAIELITPFSLVLDVQGTLNVAGGAKGIGEISAADGGAGGEGYIRIFSTNPLIFPAGNHTIDTDSGVIDGEVWPDFDGSVFFASSLTIENSATVTVTGSQPLEIETNGDALINGILDLSGAPGGNGGGELPGGAGGAGGPGGFAGGAGGGISPGTDTEDGAPGLGPGGGGGGTNGNATNSTAGGGGGGHNTAGENGSSVGSPSIAGSGGTSYACFPALQGGSGGGGGAFEDDDPQQSGTPGAEDDGGGGGGGGGGAAKITARAITMGPAGAINARGGKGGNANSGLGAAGGGGGAGGSIVLVSTGPLLPDIQGSLDVSGGARGIGEISTARGGTGGLGCTTFQTVQAPVVRSIVRYAPPTLLTNANTLVWQVTFSETVLNVDSSDFTLSGTTGTISLTPTDSSNAVFNVTITGGDLSDLEGTVVLAIAASQDITDTQGDALTNTIPTGENENTYELDNTQPTLTSILRQSPSISPTNATTLTWRVTFDENMAQVDVTDFIVSGTTGTVTDIAVATADSVFDVVVSGGDLATINGTVTLSFSGSQNVTDTAGNTLSSTAPTGTNDNTYVLDHTEPGVTSIERQNPSFSPTNANSLVWRITFNTDVSHLDVTDFSVSGTTATMTGILTVVADNIFDLTLSGGDLAAVTGVVSFSFAGTQDITDGVGNALIDTLPSGANDHFYILDNSGPRLQSITRQAPLTSPTNADTLVWRITFDENVSNLDPTDFTVSGTTGSISSLTTIIPETVFDVMVTGGDLATLNATVVLGFAPGQNVTDPLGNVFTQTTPTGTNDNTFILDNTPPQIASIVRWSPTTSPTNADTLTWRVTFDEDVGGVTASTFTLGGSTATVTQVTAVTTTMVYDVIVSGGDLAGLNAIVSLDISPAHSIMDLTGNMLTSTIPTGTNDHTYIIDNTTPTLESIVRQNPATSPTNADSLVWRLMFSEDIRNLDPSDFTVTGTTAVVTNVTTVLADTTFDILVSGGNLASVNGTVTLEFASGHNITDTSDNLLTSTVPTGTNEPSYVLDNSAPRVASILRQSPVNSPTNADSLTWRITFEEDVNNVESTDFMISGTTASISSVTAITPDHVFDIVLSGGDLTALNGTVTLGFAGTENITDTAGNPLVDTNPTGTNDNSFVIDNTAPAVASILRQSPSLVLTNADILIWRIIFNERVSQVDPADFTINGSTATITDVSTTNDISFDVTCSGGNLPELDGTVTIAFLSAHNITDTAGNPLLNTAPTGTNHPFYHLDNTPPDLTEVFAVPSPSYNLSPSYTFHSSEEGTISYYGCASSTNWATHGNNTVTFNNLAPGLYDDCSIIVTDAAGNNSDALNMTPFFLFIKTPVPTLGPYGLFLFIAGFLFTGIYLKRKQA